MTKKLNKLLFLYSSILGILAMAVMIVYCMQRGGRGDERKEFVFSCKDMDFKGNVLFSGDEIHKTICITLLTIKNRKDSFVQP